MFPYFASMVEREQREEREKLLRSGEAGRNIESLFSEWQMSKTRRA